MFTDQTAVQVEPATPVCERELEIVERKGVGHPDTICDEVMEAVSTELCRAYVAASGRVLHHNVDKALLIPGRTTPRLGGGTVDAPMQMILSGNVTSAISGAGVPVSDIAEGAARHWLNRHLRRADPDRHVVLRCEMRPGSAELAGIFAEETPTANDTSVGVGHAPLSPTECAVLEVDRLLTSRSFRLSYPEIGDDLKVMACRRGALLDLTVALAFVDREVVSKDAYFGAKAEMASAVARCVSACSAAFGEVRVEVNALDDPRRGAAGMYLTVLGTSAEAADGGQVGRGNRANGLITPMRPMSLEAVSGKNPVSHVGKIYSELAGRIASVVYQRIDPVREATVWLCSRIGCPLDRPPTAGVAVALESGVAPDDVRDLIDGIVRAELSGVGALTTALSRSGVHVI